MTPSSAKQKGRNGCKDAKATLLRHLPHLEEDDIRVTGAGAGGEDLQLSPLARKSLPFAFEVKNNESLNVWKAFRQAEAHAAGREGILPALIFKRNRSEIMISMKLEDFLAFKFPKTIDDPEREGVHL